MMYLHTVDSKKLKNQVVYFSGELSLNHDKKEIMGQHQQVLVKHLVFMPVTKKLGEDKIFVIFSSSSFISS